MNFNPFGNDNEDTSFERGAPVNQAAKNVVQGTTTQVKSAAKSVGDDITSQILGALYGPSQDQGTDEANASQTDHSNPLAHAAKQMGASNASAANSNQSPQELADLEKVRRELSGNYSGRFNTAHNGPFNISTNLEQEIERARKEREQKEMQRKQQEEEEEMRRKQEEEAKKQQIAMPA